MSEPDAARCPQCGATVLCGFSRGQAHCWCMDFPPVMPLPTASDQVACLCPECLRKAQAAALQTATDPNQNI
jgi:hypothetical protein